MLRERNRFQSRRSSREDNSNRPQSNPDSSIFADLGKRLADVSPSFTTDRKQSSADDDNQTERLDIKIKMETDDSRDAIESDRRRKRSVRKR